MTLKWIRFFPLLILLADLSAAQTSAAPPASSIDSVCLNEILISSPQDSNVTQVISAQHKADTARQAIRQGAEFGDIAKKVSDGPSAAIGGALGRFRRGVLAKSLEDKVFAMRAGEVSDVMRTKQGFVILQVTECGGTPGAAQSSGSIEILSDTRGVDFGPYLRRVRQDVQANWYRQIPGTVSTKKGKVIIEFSIMKDGSVANMRFLETSGDRSLDRAAWEGIANADPFPPLPSEFSGPYLALRLRFYYNFEKNELQ